MTARMDDAAIREAMAREPIAFEELMRVTGMGNWWCRRGEIRAHIPADKERDTDLVIGASLQDVSALAAEALARGTEVEGFRAEVERLTRELDEAEGARILNANALKAALAANEAMGREDYLNKQAIRVGGDAVRELNAEVARLRAAALPEDAEERITAALRDRDIRTIMGGSPAYGDDARAILEALRGDA